MPEYSIKQILLYTDFGKGDHYLGQMLSILSDSLPGLPVINLMTEAPRFRPKQAGYLLAAILPYLAKNIMIIAVIDPGVGSKRRGLLYQQKNFALLAPDNGLLAPSIRQNPGGQLYKISWQPQNRSNSFDGRDWFAPVAGLYLNGQIRSGSGLEPIDANDLVGSDWPHDLSEIIHIDNYGNLITGICASNISSRQQLQFHKKILGYKRTFAAAEPGRPFWYINSNGLVEIAVREGSAEQYFAATVTDKVVLRTESRFD